MSIQVWPWWVRLSHWLVVACILTLWLMRYLWLETGALHRGLGYVALALISMRIIAGLLTSHTPAQLHMPNIQSIKKHLHQIRLREPETHVGHNPLGQYAVYLMWTVLILLALSGWLSRMDAFWGEDFVVNIHSMLSWVLLTLVVLHLLAVWGMSSLSKQKLMRQMFHGRFEVSVKD